MRITKYTITAEGKAIEDDGAVSVGCEIVRNAAFQILQTPGGLHGGAGGIFDDETNFTLWSLSEQDGGHEQDES